MSKNAIIILLRSVKQLTFLILQSLYICSPDQDIQSVITNNNEIRIFEELTEQGMDTIKKASKQILGQLIGLAESFSDEDFTKPLPVLLNNSIGKHYRHIIEFYQVMLEGINSGRINYDGRKHDPKLEQSRVNCLEALKSMEKRFHEPFWSDPLELCGSFSEDSDEEFSVGTNAERELVYNIEHSVHHMAIIRIAIQHEFPQIKLDKDFGYAFSTLKHLQQK